MYARIENGEVAEYPLFEGDLEKRLPQYKFPLDTYEEENGIVVPEGYARIKPNYPQNMDMYTHYVRGLPKLVDGEWTEQFIVTPMTAQEKNDRKPYFAETLRIQRNQLLKESDLLVMNDRWETWTQEQKDAITHYRKALRDLTKQPLFPLSVQWATKPILE
jgi:hypothetical protein